MECIASWLYSEWSLCVCGIQAVPVAYEDLPVTLPAVTQYRGHDGISPLASAHDWVNTKCAK